MQDVLANDDIAYFSYMKKIHKEQGPAVIGSEVAEKSDFDAFVGRMEERGILYEYLNAKKGLFGFLV